MSAELRGIPGLLVGGTYFTGKAGQGVPDFPAQNARSRCGKRMRAGSRARSTLSALYARGHISDTEALNLTFIGQPTPVPQLFFGGYVQAAWRNAWYVAATMR